MKIYLAILNWLLLSYVVATWFYLKPLVGLAFFVGAVLGLIFTSGFVSIEYAKDENWNKDEMWRRNLFGKNYKIELPALLCFFVLFVCLSALFWSNFFLALSGFFSLLLVNSGVEALASLFLRR